MSRQLGGGRASRMRVREVEVSVIEQAVGVIAKAVGLEWDVGSGGVRAIEEAVGVVSWAFLNQSVHSVGTHCRRLVRWRTKKNK
jgi:hypothetical protein